MSVVLIVGTAKGAAILTSDKERRNWKRRFDLKGWNVTASARDDEGRFYLGVASPIFGPALFVSDDLDKWTQLDAAPRYEAGDTANALHRRFTAMTVDPMGEGDDTARRVEQIWTLHAANGQLFAGVSEAGLFVSDDRGQSWQPVRGLNEHESRKDWMPGAGGLCAHTVLSDPANPDRMWVGISAAGFFRSDDGGKTFAQKNDGIPGGVAQCVHCVTHDPARPEVLYRQDHRGVYRSDDGGDNWRVIEQGLPVSELSDGLRCSFGFPIALHRASGSLFVLPLESDQYRTPPEGKLALYTSRDSGGHWQAAANGLPEGCYAGVLRGAMDSDQLDPGGVYFGTTSGAVYGSTDLGESWAEIDTGLPRIGSVRAYDV